MSLVTSFGRSSSKSALFNWEEKEADIHPTTQCYETVQGRFFATNFASAFDLGIFEQMQALDSADRITAGLDKHRVFLVTVSVDSMWWDIVRAHVNPETGKLDFHALLTDVYAHFRITVKSRVDGRISLL